MNTVKSTFFQIIKRKETLLLLVLIIAGVTICGWLFDNYALTAFSLKYKPTSPIIAVTFIVLSILLFVNIHFDKSRLTKIVVTFSIIIITLFYGIIILGYLFNFASDIENVFVKNVNRYGTELTGYMSQIAALLFFFICIYLLLIRHNYSGIIEYIGGSLLLLVFLVSSVLSIAYLYNAPLLFGKQVIPVSLPATICFLLFSITLFRFYQSKFLIYNLIKDNKISRLLLKSFLPIAVFMIILQGFLIINFSAILNNPTLFIAITLFFVILVTILLVFRVSSIIGIKLQTAEQTLRESEKEFRSLAESMPQIVWTTRADGWNSYFNQQWVDYTGLTLEESYGHGWNKPFHPDDQQRAWDAWQNAVNNNAEYSIDCRLRCYDGTYRWWLVRGVPQIGAEGEIVKWFGTCTDIEKIKNAELALIESENKLHQLNIDKDRFISILGHDLKNPFNNILGLSEILTDEINSLKTDEIGEIAKNINKSTRITNQLLDDILMWARTQQGKIPFKPQILSFRDICLDILKTLKPNANAKNIIINYSSVDHINVIADIDMLKVVLRNLVSNAIKFTNNGGAININAEENSGNVTISVSDNGIGILPENLAKLFDISEVLTTKGTAGETGTGLGLLLCKDFVEKHRGKIWVESEVGKGSDFKFTLPVFTERSELN